MRAAPRAAPDLQSSITGQFGAAYRLLRIDGFSHALHAEKIENEYFKIFFVRNSQENARLGIVARKKILSGAPHRNRVKRFIRETFRRHDIKTCRLDMVVMVKRICAHEGGTGNDSLDALFSRVKNRCAKL